MAADTKKVRRLSAKQEMFAQLYARPGEYFGNGVQCYIEAYGIDITLPGQYGVAREGGSRLLTNPNVLARIRALLELGPLNPETVDRELAFVIAQHADMGAKMAGVREFNKLHQRIVDKSVNDQTITIKHVDQTKEDHQ